MSMQKMIERRLESALNTSYLRLVNESHRHNVPRGAETHFSAVIVSETFAELSPVARHRAVYSILGEDLRAGVHAFTMRTLTPREWQRDRRPLAHEAPPCRGGGKTRATE